MKKLTLNTLILSFSMAASTTFAADILNEVRTGSDGHPGDGGYFELGVSVDYKDHAVIMKDDDEQDEVVIDVFFAGEYRYRNFFIEGSQGSFDGLNLGYTLYQNDSWSIDLLGASIFGSLDSENDDADDPSLNEAQRDEALLERDSIYVGSGLRATAYLQGFVLQGRVVHDVYEGNGLFATLRLGRGWQYRNWNFHAVAGVEYGSKDAVQYFYGITGAEATNRFSEYTPGAATVFTGEVGVTYPISEHWVFRSGVRYTHLPNDIFNSPLVQSDTDFVFANSISYVF